jgi:hypothetical protein
MTRVSSSTACGGAASTSCRAAGRHDALERANAKGKGGGEDLGASAHSHGDNDAPDIVAENKEERWLVADGGQRSGGGGGSHGRLQKPRAHG